MRPQDLPAKQEATGAGGGALKRAFRSLMTKLLLLLVVFLLVPIIIYMEFRRADQDKVVILMQSLREQGRLMAESLRPIIEKPFPTQLEELPKSVEKLATPAVGLRVLFRPSDESGAEGFYFVAAEPTVPPALLEEERLSLLERGVLQKLNESCTGQVPIAIRHQDSAGKEELFTSLSAITTEAGCWAIVTIDSGNAVVRTSLGRPYWRTIEVQIAGLIYCAMAILVLGLYLGFWRNLVQFRDLAHGIRKGLRSQTSFAARNKIPELAFVAEEFDRMTHGLRESSEDLRRAAEDNAHAFKTPIAIMRQALEPLRRIIPGESRRGQRALSVLEQSVDRLDHLVASARQLDQAAAELLDPPRGDVDLSYLVGHMLEAYASSLEARRLRLRADLAPGLIVRASEELIETVVENVLDNAVTLSYPGTEVIVQLARRGELAELAIRDRGPGVPTDQLERIFERYVTMRAVGQSGEQNRDAQPHSGIGLWIARRNIEAVGGTIFAENRPDGGLSVIIRLPLKR